MKTSNIEHRTSNNQWRAARLLILLSTLSLQLSTCWGQAGGGVSSGPGKGGGGAATNVSGGSFSNVTLTGSSTVPLSTTSSTATNLAGGIVTNNQVINQSGTYTIPFGVSASINLTNGGNVTILGSGIITSNWLSMGAVENIVCDQYCPNGGWTAFNHYTNQWQSVTCNIQSRIADFNQGTGPANGFYEYTTNLSDVFVINATERLNFWTIEVFLDGSGVH